VSAASPQTCRSSSCDHALPPPPCTPHVLSSSSRRPSFLFSRPVVAVTRCGATRRQRALRGCQAALLAVSPALARAHSLDVWLLRPRCRPLWLRLRGPLAAVRRGLSPSGRRWGAPTLSPLGAGASPLLPVFFSPPASLRGFWVAPFPACQAPVCLPFFPGGAGTSLLLPVVVCLRRPFVAARRRPFPSGRRLRAPTLFPFGCCVPAVARCGFASVVPWRRRGGASPHPVGAGVRPPSFRSALVGPRCCPCFLCLLRRFVASGWRTFPPDRRWRASPSRRRRGVSASADVLLCPRRVPPISSRCIATRRVNTSSDRWTRGTPPRTWRTSLGALQGQSGAGHGTTPQTARCGGTHACTTCTTTPPSETSTSRTPSSRS